MAKEAKKSDKYFVRLKCEEGYEDMLQEYSTSEDIVKMLAVRHTASPLDPHEHFHFTVVLKEECRMDVYRNKLKRIFNKGKGNGHMAIRCWDGGIRCNAYMFHESTDIDVCKFIYVGYTEKEIKGFMDYNDEIQETKLSNRKKSTIEQTIMVCANTEEHITKRFIFKTYIRLMLAEGHIYPGHHRMSNIIETIVLRLPGTNIDVVSDDLYENFISVTRS